MQTVPRVALLMETSRGYGRELLRGIAEYIRLHGPWDLIVSPGDFLQTVPDLKSWGATGVICRIENELIAQQILQAGLPTIALDISQNKMIELLKDFEVSEIVSDSKGAAEMAADHLIEQILREELKAGDKVPSVRELAATTEVNPNTVMRTISYLQEQDIIFNKRGIGNFVSDDAYEKTRTMRKEDFIQQYLPEFFKTMKLLKMDFKDLEEIYKKQMNGKN